jgi:hypothetical protein
MVKKIAEIALGVLALSIAGTGAAWATGGCVNSPENPTLVLAMLGSAATGLPWARARLSAWRKQRSASAAADQQ